ncbi:MAG: hypothetical protein Q9167_000116 [Letrouitia subvulpina]
MADRLTQLQDCLDQLLTQFYASLRYLSSHHDSSSLDPQSNQPPYPASDTAPTQRVDSPSDFKAAQKELAQDLVTKTKQIEYLIRVLPGLESSEQQQEERIGRLEMELREAEEERNRAAKEKEAWMRELDMAIMRVRR